MTNLSSIVGGALWSLTAILLVFTALEPVSIAGPEARLAATAPRSGHLG